MLKPCSDFWESPEPGHCFQQGLAGIESVEPITLSVTARHAPSDAARAGVKSEGSIKDSIKVRILVPSEGRRACTHAQVCTLQSEDVPQDDVAETETSSVRAQSETVKTWLQVLRSPPATLPCAAAFFSPCACREPWRAACTSRERPAHRSEMRPAALTGSCPHAQKSTATVDPIAVLALEEERDGLLSQKTKCAAPT